MTDRSETARTLTAARRDYDLALRAHVELRNDLERFQRRRDDLAAELNAAVANEARAQAERREAIRTEAQALVKPGAGAGGLLRAVGAIADKLTGAKGAPNSTDLRDLLAEVDALIVEQQARIHAADVPLLDAHIAFCAALRAHEREAFRETVRDALARAYVVGVYIFDEIDDLLRRHPITFDVASGGIPYYPPLAGARADVECRVNAARLQRAA